MYVNAVGYVLIIVLPLVMIEATARVAYAYRNEVAKFIAAMTPISTVGHLDPYEMIAPENHAHWRLRPNFSSAMGISVNSDGFKGKELAHPKASPRLLVVGDSTAFGMAGYDYPQFIERRLAELGNSIEVVNGGVEGYSVKNALNELPRFDRVQPDFVLIMLGWNNLFSDVPWSDAPTTVSRTAWWVAKFWKYVAARWEGERTAALRLYRRKLTFDCAAGDVKTLSDYRPPAIEEIEQLVGHMTSRKVPVFLASLPSLFVVGEAPSAWELEIGHAPEFTTNACVLAMLNLRYRAELVEAAARHGVNFIDAYSWATKELSPRSSYFTDSVHLTAKGYGKLGTYLADELLKHGVTAKH